MTFISTLGGCLACSSSMTRIQNYTETLCLSYIESVNLVLSHLRVNSSTGIFRAGKIHYFG